jgi:hypothetical protein
VAPPRLLFAAHFPRAGLDTNEYAYWNPGDPKARRNADWELTSGTLYARGGNGWTGIPDDEADPDAGSSNGTDSAIFRLTTRRANFADVSVRLRLHLVGLLTTPTTPAEPWDGVHVWLRYRSQRSLYYVSVSRRDGTAVIKKKCPGGPDNGGTYVDLSAYVPHAAPPGSGQTVRVDVRTTGTNTVRIDYWSNRRHLLSALDHGQRCPAITTPGKIGLRGDNADFEFGHLTVSALS